MLCSCIENASKLKVKENKDQKLKIMGIKLKTLQN